ncbi:MAG: glycoside hydrolase family 127 protein [Eubacteriales bacterium]|nr:glycoside hydrolase family 127 protein [Eubacteriales bacterium]
MLHFVPLKAVFIDDAFWRKEQQLVRNVVIPYQWEILNDRVPNAEPSYCIHNFRIAAGKQKGSFGGAVFQDTDLYKWLEAVAYCLTTEKDEKLEALADETIDLIAEAQQPDGYLDTYYTIAEPEHRWHNLMEGHELYCAGHFIEAAVAYYAATGKRKILDIAIRLADCIQKVFFVEKHGGYPGHPEIELALIKLYFATEERRYLELSKYFVDSRGQNESWFAKEQSRPGHRYIWPDMEFFGDRYFQDYAPVREQREANGHAVRAMYLYSAMADLGRIFKDHELEEACNALYHNVTQRQMYVTGAIGSAAYGERFTSDYDLPNDTVYAETCASIGLMMFSSRMFLLTGNQACYDSWERALYNTVLAGMGSDGRHFFYVNPLEVIPAFVHSSPTLQHVKTLRPKWYGVACCPPNIARTVSSLGGSLYAMDDQRLHVLTHIGSSFQYQGVSCRLQREKEDCVLTIDAPTMEIVLRKPEGFVLEGDEVIRHPGGKAEYHYRLLPQVRFLRANTHVAADEGKVCVMRGETVYCMEEIDNGKQLNALYADTSVLPTENDDGTLTLKGWRREDWGEALYSEKTPAYKPMTLTLIPYSQWNNRGEGEMRVWLNEACPSFN